ncbi:GNAT family N-acetyltransferase [Streptomyces sp. CoH27]|uniref:GNAT family N-acetyltransferase n=1 Tax=Streptomyces sp. CoH27 TaxID=2875763 RepID=UPI001CD6C7FA|nr:GNAT family N-acetyltransferase [Streptomyces sp. CoH27]
MAEADRWIAERPADGRRQAWVAEHAGTLHGHVFLHLVERVPEPYEDNTPFGYVTNLYVTADHRGRGLGARLPAALRAHAREQGLEVLIVRPSERSVPLCRRSGFEPSAEVLESRA